jgi:predicted CxxxxCH...CXXCH cytochrome family protein
MKAIRKVLSARAVPVVGALAFLLSALLLPGCTSNPGNGGLVDAQGRHPAGFATNHAAYAVPGGAPCRECHGETLGKDNTPAGISGVSCYTASFDNLACHAGGPAFHPADWVSTHGAVAATDNGASCRPCHGADLHGSGSVVSCYTASFGGVACHANGPAFHPASWLDCTAPGNAFHGNAYANNVPVCSTCHDVTPSSPKCTATCHFTLGGGRIPPSIPAWSHGIGTSGTATSHHQAAIFDNAAVKAVCIACHDTHNRFGQPPVCHNCHGSANPHPAGWLLSHAPAARSSTAGCSTAECHGTSLQGASGRACASCHKGEALLSHLSDCRSCHGNPPPGTPPLSQPTGEPNVAGAHAIHGALPAGVASACSTCHAAAGAATARHFDNVVEVSLTAAWNARTGGPARAGAGRTCLGVSCHGGKATPDWRAVPPALRGTSGANCTGCHNTAAPTPATAQWNDWDNTFFPRHGYHIVSRGFACTRCHDTTRMPNSLHFATLGDNAMTRASAQQTLFTTLAYDPAQANQSSGCTTPATGCH